MRVQVLDEIVQLLTEPAFMGKMVVILAGYESQVRALGRVHGEVAARDVIVE